MTSLLIVEDDRAICELMVRTLTLNGHKCLAADTGGGAVSVIQNHLIDLVLLDINLPDTSGFRLMEQLEGIPVIYVTARNEIRDRIRGLDGGAEDYIVKPFHIQELISRVNVVLRRYSREDIFCLGKVRAELANHKVYMDQKEIALTKQGFELLKTLICNKNITLTREQLLNAAWSWDFEGDERTVDVHIQRLRKKLHWERYIKTIYKTSYRLEIVR